ncbi:MAG: von Willebrand factor type [Verrucomicrobiales bacterium]|nr:von Willebrand factor type [Verrucomicrobiales bacterium]
MISFGHPYVLFFLLLIPLLAWLKGKTGQHSAFLYSSIQLIRPIAGLHRSRAGKVLLLLRWLSVALLIISMAQPRRLRGELRAKAKGIDIVVCFDLSTSMAAEDFEVNGSRVSRINVARGVLQNFIKQRENDRIGLVAFAGDAYTACPLTLDHDYLLQNLNRLRFGLIEDRTAIGSAITLAVNRLRAVESKSKVIILMTDGQNNAGKIAPVTAAEVAKTLGIKIYTIGVGTHGNAPTPQLDRNGEIVRDFFGNPSYFSVPVDIDEPTLQKIAEMTSGIYFRADSTDTLLKIYQEINKQEKTEVNRKKIQQFEQYFKWPLLTGLCVLMLEVILSQTRWRRIP